MKATVEKLEQNVAQINLTIDADHASQEYNKAARRLGQRLNIPGFRRGKAPRSIIEKNIGQDRIKQEALDRILPHAFADVISEHQLDIVAAPRIETFDFDLQKGIEVKAQVELRPEVTLGSLENLAVTVPEFKVPEDALEKELNMIVERMTTLEPVIDRPCEESDIVNIDFAGKVDGEEIKGGTAKNYRLDLTNNNFIEGFADQVKGHKLSEEFTINVTFPKDYHDNNLAGKAATFEIKINEINKRVVPELDDELAKKIGPYESVDALKQEIKDLLAKNEEEENKFRKHRALIDVVVDASTVSIPDSMIDREANLLVSEAQQRFKSQGLNWDDFVQSQGSDKVMENIRNDATRRIKTSLVFGAISKQENIQVTEDEFQAEVTEQSTMRNMDPKEVMRQFAKQPQAVQSMTDQILATKIVDHLSEKATFTFVPDVPDEADEATVKDNDAVAKSLEGTEFDVLDSEKESDSKSDETKDESADKDAKSAESKA